MTDASVVVLPDGASVAAAAEARVLESLSAARAASRVPTLFLSGGSTPEVLYRRFAAGPAEAFADVHLFYGDERAVPPDHADSNHAMVTRAWLHRGTVPAGHIHRVRGEATDLDAEATRYAAELDAVLGPAGAEVMLLGMGEDAHTASIFPGTPAVDAPGRVFALHQGAPRHARITVTVGEIRRATRVLVLVTGAAKAEVLRDVLKGPVNQHRMPVQCALRGHPGAVLLCDAGAASRL